MPEHQDRALATWEDLKVLIMISLGYLITAVWPRRWDRRLVAWHAALFYRFGSGRIKQLEALMGHALGAAASGRDLFQTARDHYRMRIEVAWGRIRDLHRHGWAPQIEVDGLHHIRQGLAGGRGVILWGMRFCGFTLAKAALWRAGIRVTHLSRADHCAPSPSWLGLRVIARLEALAETRYLDRRLVMPLDESLGHLRNLMESLERNACVSIIGELKGRQNVKTEFLGGVEKFATGAPGLAWKTQSTLLTYYVIPEGSFRYRVVIDPPIELDRDSGRHEFVRTAIEEFGRRLQAHVVQHPAGWDRWNNAYLEVRALQGGDFERLVPPGASFILVDGNHHGTRLFEGRRAIPFLEQDGQYRGAPPDDETAIRELERLRQEGASFMAFVWPAFWWFDYYSGFHRYLRSHCQCVLKNKRLVVFDLRTERKRPDVRRSHDSAQGARRFDLGHDDGPFKPPIANCAEQRRKPGGAAPSGRGLPSAPLQP